MGWRSGSQGESCLRYQVRPLYEKHLGWYVKGEKGSEMGREKSEGECPEGKNKLDMYERKYANSCFCR